MNVLVAIFSATFLITSCCFAQPIEKENEITSCEMATEEFDVLIDMFFMDGDGGNDFNTREILDPDFEDDLLEYCDEEDIDTSHFDQ